MKTKSPKKVADKKSVATVSLFLGDKVYEGKGETILEALRAMEKPLKITHRSQLVVSTADKQRMLQLNIPQAKRLFFPLAQQVVAKQLTYGLK